MSRGNTVRLLGWFGVALCILASAAASAAEGERVLFSTGFEPSEGYNPDLTLVDQNGWVGFNSGGNGLVTNFFEGLGQQAFIGFAPPKETNEFLSVYRPINLAPIKTNESLIKFSVLMQIADSSSTNGPWDDFRWSVYNTNGARLFSVDFDNAALMISYALDDSAGFVPTNTKFDNLGYYQLGIAMNFARNLWTATLNDQVLVNAKPITTSGAALNLGDIDAVWSFHNPRAPGDNFMLFDNFTITAEATTSIPARLESLGVRGGKAYQLRLYGEPSLSYRIETSTDLQTWQPLLTLTAPAGGILEFEDSLAATVPHRFFRAYQAP
jgi:hypothetical protein